VLKHETLSAEDIEDILHDKSTHPAR
jgi:hypothetical protein